MRRALLIWLSLQNDKILRIILTWLIISIFTKNSLLLSFCIIKPSLTDVIRSSNHQPDMKFRRIYFQASRTFFILIYLFIFFFIILLHSFERRLGTWNSFTFCEVIVGSFIRIRCNNNITIPGSFRKKKKNLKTRKTNRKHSKKKSWK